MDFWQIDKLAPVGKDMFDSESIGQTSRRVTGAGGHTDDIESVFPVRGGRCP